MGKKLLNFILFLVVTATAVIMTIYVGQDQKSIMIYNFAFLGAMCVLYLGGMFTGMFRMEDIANALSRATKDISEVFKMPGKVAAKDLQMLDGMFEYRYLDLKYRAFSDDIGKTPEGIGDVEDYINEEELSIRVHKRILEMIPDIFTSLGILGTFVGLVWGLRNFEPNNYETMTTSVTSLVDGIKVAFLTSIYGIAYSIVYSYGMKSVYSSMTSRLQAFLNKFHSYVMPAAENEAMNMLVSSQKIQTDAMNTMTDKFSIQMADSFEKVITPTFQKMNDSLDMLINSVTRVQTDAVQDILNVFVKEMRSSFQMQFDDFNMALEYMNKAQKDNTEYAADLYQAMSRELEASFVQQDKSMKDSVTQMGNLQTRFMAAATKIIQENQAIQKAQQEDYQHIIDYLKDAEESSAKFWVACNQTMKRYVEAAADSMEGIQVQSANGVQVVNEASRVTQDFEVRLKEFGENQKATIALMQEVSRLLSDIGTAGSRDVYLSGGRRDEVGQQRALDRLYQLMEKQGEQQLHLLEEMGKDMKELKTALQKGKFSLFK